MKRYWPGSRRIALIPIGNRTTDGILLVDKPAGATSHDMVAVARRHLNTRRIGHAGTLDPFATGLLVLLAGRATRLLPYLEGEPKVYEATIEFGSETTTDDLTGEVTRRAAPPSTERVNAAVTMLTGDIEQTPPDFSAKQVGGVRAYRAARSGRPLALSPARVLVHQWSILERSEQSLRTIVTCSGGTYVRALARDLGRLSDSAAHLTALRRLASGVFHVEDAVRPDQLASEDPSLRPMQSAIPSMPTQQLDDDASQRVVHGNSIAAPVEGDRVALLDGAGDLVAIAVRVGEVLQPRVVFGDA